MGYFPSWTGAAPINHQIKRTGLLTRSWQLRWKPVCGSTETELLRWLKSKPILQNNPRAFLAGRQSHGKGQRGRIWEAPLGGVWLSAAIPCELSKQSAGLFGLAIAFALAERLEKDLIPVKIKWPNDLLVEHRKIAGLLPRVVYRGEKPTLICVGIGLNVSNRVPSEGISLLDASNEKNISINKWSLEVLVAIEKATLLINNPEALCFDAERFLWSRKTKKPNSDEMWNIDGLDCDGQLVVSRGLRKEKWTRW